MVWTVHKMLSTEEAVHCTANKYGQITTSMNLMDYTSS
eukprot:gene14948-4443_t